MVSDRFIVLKQPVKACHSNVDLLGHFQGIVDLDTEVTHRAVEIGMAEQQLYGPEILGSSVNQGCLGAA